MGNTTRWNLPWPAGSDLIAQGDDAIRALAESLDDVAKFASGTFAARPAQPVTVGSYYLATDQSILYVSTGSAWLEVAPGAGSVPIGGLIDYAGSSDPADTRFLLADGRVLSQTTYSALFGVIGTAFNTGGEGAGNFRIPDKRGRTSVGPDSMGTGTGAAGRLTTNNARGNTGGAQNVTLTSDQMPSHSHTQQTHTHGFEAGSATWQVTLIGVTLGPTDLGFITNARTFTAGATPTINPTGGGLAHENMPPYVVLNQLLRVL